jgi:uncharacterized membrane protein YuzA (DUF378 family)
MQKEGCIMCKVIEGLVILGAFNLGMIGIANFNFLAAIFGYSRGTLQLVYIVIGFCGIIQAIKGVKLCPCGGKEGAEVCKK